MFLRVEKVTLTDMIPALKDANFLNLLSQLKIGETVQLAVTDWTNETYNGGFFLGKIFKFSNEYIACFFESISSRTVEIQNSVLNFFSQRETNMEVLDGIYLFHNALRPLSNFYDVQRNASHSSNSSSLDWTKLISSVSENHSLVASNRISQSCIVDSPLLRFIQDQQHKSFASAAMTCTSQSVYHDEQQPWTEMTETIWSTEISNGFPSLEIYSRAFHESSIGMALIDHRYSFVSVNKSFAFQLGYSLEELLSNTFLPITHQEDIPRCMAFHRQLLTGKIRGSQILKRFLHRKGNFIWHLLISSVIQSVPFLVFSQAIPLEDLRGTLENALSFPQSNHS